MDSFTMKRDGEWSIVTVGPHHCGTKELPDKLKVKYHFELECTHDSLDERGFLVDQLMVHEFFTGIKKTDKSCELFALKAANTLFDHVMALNGACKVKRISVTLSPEPFQASLTFERIIEKRRKAA